MRRHFDIFFFLRVQEASYLIIRECVYIYLMEWSRATLPCCCVHGFIAMPCRAPQISLIALTTLWPGSDSKIGFLHCRGFSKTFFQVMGPGNCRLDEQVRAWNEELGTLYSAIDCCFPCFTKLCKSILQR